jgi:hypothetical protein
MHKALPWVPSLAPQKSKHKNKTNSQTKALWSFSCLLIKMCVEWFYKLVVGDSQHSDKDERLSLGHWKARLG